MEPYSFIRAFEPGIRARTRHYGLAIIWCRTVGELVVTSGKIVARDPGYFKGVRWERAKRLEQPVETPEKEEPFCYCVDSGTGCFMDKDAANLLLEWKEQDEHHLYAFLNEHERSIPEGSEWSNLDAATGLDVIAFTSGWGDGGYPSCWGYNGNDKPVYLATDFGVLSGATFLEDD